MSEVDPRLRGQHPLLIDVAGLSDYETARRLACLYGGRRLYIPVKLPNSRHYFLRRIGRPGFEALIKLHGGKDVYIPMWHTVKKTQRRYRQLKAS